MGGRVAGPQDLRGHANVVTAGTGSGIFKLVYAAIHKGGVGRAASHAGQGVAFQNVTGDTGRMPEYVHQWRVSEGNAHRR